jgi:DNA-binding NarL/FixJ family response regulator
MHVEQHSPQLVSHPASKREQALSLEVTRILLLHTEGEECEKSMDHLLLVQPCRMSDIDDRAVRRVIAGSPANLIWLSPGVAERLWPTSATNSATASIDEDDLEHALSHLDDRKAEVVRLLGKGLRNGEIASSLGLKARTVRTVLSNLYLEYEVTNRTELLGLLMEQGHEGRQPQFIKENNGGARMRSQIASIKPGHQTYRRAAGAHS